MCENLFNLFVLQKYGAVHLKHHYQSMFVFCFREMPRLVMHGANLSNSQTATTEQENYFCMIGKSLHISFDIIKF